ncbi:hypothetical protein [Basilea psittacipulmonis]|uniref:hypothetical protein n=1 Tax=Basilea psittacipulmonis TaxID=1472345 RepID=UPI00157AB7E8|nr:hypothetical protein [Basilea psittacipulmonis]
MGMDASMYGSIAGMLSDGAGAYFGAKTNKYNLQGQAAVAEAQAKIQELNARNAELTAQSTLAKGQHEVAQLTLQAGHLKSAQRTRLAANGVDIGYGSAAEIQASTDLMKEVDMNTIKANALRSAWGHRMQALNYKAQASSLRTEAGNLRASAKRINPWMLAGQSILGSATKISEDYLGKQKEAKKQEQINLSKANASDDPIGTYIKLSDLSKD